MGSFTLASRCKEITSAVLLIFQLAALDALDLVEREDDFKQPSISFSGKLRRQGSSYPGVTISCAQIDQNSREAPLGSQRRGKFSTDPSGSKIYFSHFKNEDERGVARVRDRKPGRPRTWLLSYGDASSQLSLCGFQPQLQFKNPEGPDATFTTHT